MKYKLLKNKAIGIGVALAFCFICVGCSVNSDATSNSLYIVKDTYFSVMQTGTDVYSYSYSYKIVDSSGEIMFEATDNRRPTVTYIGSGVVRLLINHGSNAWESQYFDVWNHRVSEVYVFPSLYADYVGNHEDSEQAIIAYYTKEDELDWASDIMLIVRRIFSGDIVASIRRPFISLIDPGDHLFFLNEHELFADYDVLSETNEQEKIREIIVF